jgi:hypothetical protein
VITKERAEALTPQDSIRPILEAGEEVLRWAGKELALANPNHNPNLDTKVTLVIQSKGRASRCGQFHANSWSTKEGAPIHEIFISSEHLKQNTLEIINTLIHERVHMWNHQNGIDDCSAGGRHNIKGFKTTCESIKGYSCEFQSKSIGYGLTKILPELEKKLRLPVSKGGLDIDKLDIVFNKFKELPPRTKTPTKSIKYTCPKCNATFRATKPISVECVPCGTRFTSNSPLDILEELGIDPNIEEFGVIEEVEDIDGNFENEIQPAPPMGGGFDNFKEALLPMGLKVKEIKAAWDDIRKANLLLEDTSTQVQHTLQNKKVEGVVSFGK